MGKRKRLVERIDPARQRAVALYGECSRYGVGTIYDLPASVHLAHRAARLQEMVRVTA